jgi:Fe(3+) dicitrate transport protein
MDCREYNNRNSDGFKTIDNSSKNTGFRGNDYVAKFRVNSDADAKVYQSLTAKLQYSEDFANETYLGLTTIIEKSLQKICGF